ncbi:LON peptidase substrate-binding domain-containing protein (plasmid) [Pseudoalteromonas sp. T1lg65]|uniref:LON peptidase substrate-binding domain-containing protein n=1 Tax=Pseudoalteromonas sp. T1lg65 TaxID=2077101 RepID=UPI003F79811C
MRAAIFPLPVFLLPGGYTRLKIFEQRYLKMVTDAMKGDRCFILCTYSDTAPHNVPREGVLVEIIDFSQDENAQLLIDVYAKHLVVIGDVDVNAENLRHGEYVIINDPPWQYCDDDLTLLDDDLANRLELVFLSNPILDDLYREKHYSDALWVTSRWLELLPISTKQKEKVRSATKFSQVAEFLHTVFEENE